MQKRVTARIKWVPTEHGGKKRFPIKDYSTAAHFLDSDQTEAWSVVLKINSNYDDYITICDFCFLFPERAPQELVYIGSKFELFESRKVAEGEIIDIYFD